MWYLLVTSRSGHVIYASQEYASRELAEEADANTTGYTVVRSGRARIVPDVVYASPVTT